MGRERGSKGERETGGERDLWWLNLPCEMNPKGRVPGVGGEGSELETGHSIGTAAMELVSSQCLGTILQCHTHSPGSPHTLSG